MKYERMAVILPRVELKKVILVTVLFIISVVIGRFVLFNNTSWRF